MRNGLLRLLPLVALLGLAACEDDTADCPEENLVCSGVCTAIASDRENCGGCGVTCGDQQCIDGQCACPAGQELCDGRCVDLQDDPGNCGACGNTCTSTELCIEGACGCPGGADSCVCAGTVCDEVCVDTDADEMNCGGCGIECGEGLQCSAGTCVIGEAYVACFAEGTVAPFLRAGNTKGSPSFGGIDGPQALAIAGERGELLLVAGTLDATFTVVDRGTMQELGGATTGESPYQILSTGDHAYVINSSVNTVQVFDLADPRSPETVDEVSTGAGTNPMGAAFDEAKTLWVSLWLTGQVLPIDFADGPGVAGEPIDLPEVEGSRQPAGVGVSGGTVFVALNNLDSNWAPAGNGKVATVDLATKATALIDLGATCSNAGFVEVDEGVVYVSCAGAYGADAGEVVAIDAASKEITRRVATGGAAGRISVDRRREGVLYVANSAANTFYVIDADDAVTEVTACAPGDFEFVSDLLVGR